MTEFKAYQEIDRDRAERWTPSPPAREMAAAMLAAAPGAEMVIVPLVQPGKARGIWTMGQVVVTVPGVYLLAGDVPGAMPYREARDMALQAAEDAAHGYAAGTTAFALIERDGCVVVFED